MARFIITPIANPLKEAAKSTKDKKKQFEPKPKEKPTKAGSLSEDIVDSLQQFQAGKNE
jgi:hypothetical protein